MAAAIPGNRYSETTIYADTTVEFLREELARITGAQQANRRNSPRFVAYTRKLRRAIEARA